MANIARCLIGDWKRITVVDPEEVRSSLPAIKYPMKIKYFGLTETKLFLFHGILKINEIKSAKRTPTSLYL